MEISSFFKNIIKFFVTPKQENSSRSIKIPLKKQPTNPAKTDHCRLPLHPIPTQITSMQETYRMKPSQPELTPTDITLEPGKRLLLLDLDKTLIYYHRNFGFHIRPHLETFLNSIQEYYTIYIFTAANHYYASSIIKSIEKKGGRHIKGILCRRYCSPIILEDKSYAFIKDIARISDCHPKDILVVDDNVWSFCLNPENALRVTPFKGEKQDKQLLVLLDQARQAAKHEDIREFVKMRCFPQQ